MCYCLFFMWKIVRPASGGWPFLLCKCFLPPSAICIFSLSFVLHAKDKVALPRNPELTMLYRSIRVQRAQQSHHHTNTNQAARLTYVVVVVLVFVCSKCVSKCVLALSLYRAHPFKHKAQNALSNRAQSRGSIKGGVVCRQMHRRIDALPYSSWVSNAINALR